MRAILLKLPYFRRKRAVEFLSFVAGKAYWPRQYEEYKQEEAGNPVCINCAFYRPGDMLIFGKCMNSANWQLKRMDATGKGFVTVDDPLVMAPVFTAHDKGCSLFR